MTELLTEEIIVAFAMATFTAACLPSDGEETLKTTADLRERAELLNDLADDIDTMFARVSKKKESQ